MVALGQSAGGGAKTLESTLPRLSVFVAALRGGSCWLAEEGEKLVAVAAEGAALSGGGLSSRVAGSLPRSVSSFAGPGDLCNIAAEWPARAGPRATATCSTWSLASGQSRSARTNAVTAIAASKTSERFVLGCLSWSAGPSFALGDRLSVAVCCCPADSGDGVFTKRKGNGSAAGGGGREPTTRFVPKGSVWMWPLSDASPLEFPSIDAAGLLRAFGNVGADPLS